MLSARIAHMPAVTGTLKLPLASLKLIARRPLEFFAGKNIPGNPRLELPASTNLPEMLDVAFVPVRFVMTV